MTPHAIVTLGTIWASLFIGSLFVVAGDGAYGLDSFMDRLSELCNLFVKITGIIILCGIPLLVWLAT